MVGPTGGGSVLRLVRRQRPLGGVCLPAVVPRGAERGRERELRGGLDAKRGLERRQVWQQGGQAQGIIERLSMIHVVVFSIAMFLELQNHYTLTEFSFAVEKLNVSQEYLNFFCHSGCCFICRLCCWPCSISCCCMMKTPILEIFSFCILSPQFCFFCYLDHDVGFRLRGSLALEEEFDTIFSWTGNQRNGRCIFCPFIIFFLDLTYCLPRKSSYIITN